MTVSISLDDERDPRDTRLVLLDRGYITCHRCSIGENPKLVCEHIIKYVRTRCDVDLLRAVGPLLKSQHSLNHFNVWVPFVTNGRFVVDTLVTLKPFDSSEFDFDMDVDDLWSAWLPLPMQGHGDAYSNLGFVRTTGFSRRDLAIRASQNLMLLGQEECTACGYSGPDLAISQSIDTWNAEDRIQLLKRGAIMAASNSCDICVDMIDGIKAIKPNTAW